MLGLVVLTGGNRNKKKKKDREAEVEPVVEVAPPPPPPPSYDGPLWPAALPMEVGPLPDGLPSLSAQGCNGCHYSAHEQWSHSGHARGWADADLQAAFQAAGTPACRTCHQPLAVQHRQLASYDGGDINRPVLAVNESFDATLHTEGVTCVTCHVRDGAVLTARPIEGAPHPTLVSEALASSEACATCHQLTWPDADAPFYDTYGEWQRSPQAAIGLGCVDCHMTSGADARLGHDHGTPVGTGRAVSLLVDVDRAVGTRGGEPLQVTLTLQNTGAGHHFPTGSPFVGVDLDARLVVQLEDGSTEVVGEPFVAPLVRTLEPAAPWNTVSDTRLAAGEERVWSWTAELPLRAPSGTWALQTSLTRTHSGSREDEPLVFQRVELLID